MGEARNILPVWLFWDTAVSLQAAQRTWGLEGTSFQYSIEAMRRVHHLRFNRKNLPSGLRSRKMSHHNVAIPLLKAACTYHISTSALDPCFAMRAHVERSQQLVSVLTWQETATDRLNFIQWLIKLHGLRHSCPDGPGGDYEGLTRVWMHVAFQCCLRLITEKKKCAGCIANAKRRRSAGLRRPSAAWWVS